MLQSEMIKNEKHQKERAIVRNTLEEYIYDMRIKLDIEGLLAPYVIEAERKCICMLLNDIEKWLRQECDDCDIEQFNTALVDLQVRIEPIGKRIIEREQQPTAFKALSDTIQLSYKAVADRGASVKCHSPTKKAMLILSKAVEEAQKMYDKQIETFLNLPKSADLPFKYTDIVDQQHMLDACMNSALEQSNPPNQEQAKAFVRIVLSLIFS